MAYRKTCGRCLAEAKRTTRSSRNSERSGWLVKRVGSLGERMADVARSRILYRKTTRQSIDQRLHCLPPSRESVASPPPKPSPRPSTSTGFPPSSFQSRRIFPSTVVQRRRTFQTVVNGLYRFGSNETLGQNGHVEFALLPPEKVEFLHFRRMKFRSFPPMRKQPLSHRARSVLPRRNRNCFRLKPEVCRERSNGEAIIQRAPPVTIPTSS